LTKTPKQRIISTLRWIGWVFLVQFVLINVSAALYAYKLTHFYKNVPAVNSNSNGNIFSRSWRLFTGPRYPRPAVDAQPVMPYDTVKLQTKSGLEIDGWLTKKDSAKGVVILFHGISDTKAALLDEANEFYYEGYDVFMIDFRGHGNTEGNTTTIGSRESEEISLAFDYCKNKGIKNIFLYGSSMGAVAIAKAIAENDIQPSGIILEMPFGSLQSYLKGRARILGFPKQPFAFLTTFWIGVERGFNGYKHSTIRYAKKIHCPVLLQWGTLDNLVLQKETDAIYNAIPSADKKLVIYNGAQHESFLRKDPLKWRIEINSFLEKWSIFR